MFASSIRKIAIYPKGQLSGANVNFPPGNIVQLDVNPARDTGLRAPYSSNDEGFYAVTDSSITAKGLVCIVGNGIETTKGKTKGHSIKATIINNPEEKQPFTSNLLSRTAEATRSTSQCGP